MMISVTMLIMMVKMIMLMPLTRFAVVGTIVNFLLTGTILVLIQVFTILFTLLVLTILQLLFGLDEGFHNSIFNFSCDVTYLVMGQVSEGNFYSSFDFDTFGLGPQFV